MMCQMWRYTQKNAVCNGHGIEFYCGEVIDTNLNK